MALNGAPAGGKTPDGGGGGVDPRASASAAAAVAAGVPRTFANIDVNGGYVAAGVGLRNRGAGTITVSGIPSGAVVQSAYLYWSVLGGAAEPATFRSATIGRNAGGRYQGRFRPRPVLEHGDDRICLPRHRHHPGRRERRLRAVRFRVRSHIGADPFNTAEVPPLTDGASLVVVFRKSTYPLTRVVIADGYGMVNTAAGLTATIPFGFAATTPAGQVQTTFVGGDGQQNLTEPASTINGVAIPQADWDGTDPPSPAGSQGNLWDTDTVTTRNLVKSGNTGAVVKVAGGPDCLVWVAQVLSIGRNGAADADGDQLLDGWEANGYDADGDGVIDVDLPAFGASVVRKDLFVEMDYMGAESVCPCRLPQAAELNRIVAVFAAAPGAKNPNRQTGIALHLDAGTARGSTFNLGGGNRVPVDSHLNPVVPQFAAIKAANFDPRRARIFYYIIWADGYDGGGSSGNAFAIANDSFLVSLGAFPGHGTANHNVGTFIHEFGHGAASGTAGTTTRTTSRITSA